MNPKLPIKSKLTERIISSVLPPTFKMVEDQNSNGFKFINLLYGVEFEHLEKTINKTYHDSFLPSMDLSNEHMIYEAYISGIPTTQYLNTNSSPKIKITDDTEFKYGSPTRLVALSGTLPILMYTQTYTGTETVSGFNNGFDKGFNNPCWSSISGIVGLEYMRYDLRGSGYLVISSDIDQEVAYLSGVWPTFVIDVGNNLKTSGDYKNTYGLFTGLAEISLSGNNRVELVEPMDEQTLRQQYPSTREIIDLSGRTWTIGHYTPDNGYKILPGGNVVANVNDPDGYYFNDRGTKIFYKTELNNPYGSGNFTKAFLSIDAIPVSGTLKVFDIDLLDVSGNAIEIPSSGKQLYRYQSPKMHLGLSGQFEGEFDPVYVGYESIVPSGYNYGSIEGSGATPFKNTTWGYLHDGLKFDSNTLSWVDGTGAIINAIWISGYNSRYMVEYQTKLYDSVRYFSSVDTDGLVSFYTAGPLVTVGTRTSLPVEYEFTRNPDYGSSNTKIITLDGIKYRPNSMIDSVSFNVPVTWQEGNLQGPIYQNTSKEYIGYSNEFIPKINSRKNNIIECQFDSLTNTENNKLSANYNFTYSGVSPKLNINYDKTLGKKILNLGSSSFFYLDSTFQLNSNYHFTFNFSVSSAQSGILMDVSDYSNQRNIKFEINQTGYLKVYSKDRVFTSKTPIQFNNKKKSLILKYVLDEVPGDAQASIPDISLFFKEDGNGWYTPVELSKTNYTAPTITLNYFHIFKNLSVNIGSFKVYHDIYEEE